MKKEVMTNVPSVLNGNPDPESLDALKRFSLEFASKLFKESVSDNMIISPLSIFYIFLMLLNGASSPKLESLILEYMNMDDSRQANELAMKIYEHIFFTQKTYRDDEKRYGEDEDGQRPDSVDVRVQLCNSAWVSKEYEIKEEYIDLLLNLYTSIGQIDYSNPLEMKRISDWIKRQTRGQISPSLSLDKESIITLINAIYFDEDWKHKFYKDDTKEGTFYSSDGSEITVDYMKQKTWGFYSDFGNVRTLSKPLKDDYEFYFVLPDPDFSIEELLNDQELYSRVFREECETHAEITLKLPKFDYTTKLNLKEKAEIIDAKEILDSRDYYRIASDFPEIRQCLHEAKIKIDEKGVEAAAITIAIVAVTGIPALPQDRTEFVFDRPFLFGIRNTSLDVWMFLGVCNNPTEH